jgi:hypothetical protein
MIFDSGLAHRFLDLYDQGVLKREALMDRLRQCMVPAPPPLLPLEISPEVMRRAMKIWPDE